MTQPAFEEFPQSVLIVDESAESREVLRTVLGRRGLDILEATCGSEGLQILRQRHPQVVVVDLEAEQAADPHLQGAYEDASREIHSSLVVLGRLARPVEASGNSQVIAKPYHYGPLIRTIEQLLQRP